MFRFLPILAYLLALFAIVVWRFGAGPEPYEIADRARVADCTFAPEAVVNVGAAQIRMTADYGLRIDAADGGVYLTDVAPESTLRDNPLGFCPDPPTGGIDATYVTISGPSSDMLLMEIDIEDRRFSWINLEPDQTPAPEPTAQWSIVAPVGDKGAVQTVGRSPGGLLIGATCDAEDGACALWAVNPDLRIKVSLSQVAHVGAVVSGDAMPADLIAHATKLFGLFLGATP